MKTMILRNSIITLIVLAFCSAAAGAEKKRIAVLPFNTKNVSQVTGEIVRDIIEVELISTRSFTVLERDQIDLILKEQKIKAAACDETACAYKYGKALSIDYLVIGKVMKLKNYVVSLRLVDVRNQVVLSAEKMKSDSVQDLEEVAERISENFLDQLGRDNSVSYKGKIRRNRAGSITQIIYFQYSVAPQFSLARGCVPVSYGSPFTVNLEPAGMQAIGGGTSSSVALFHWLSIRGDISAVYGFSVRKTYSEDGSFTEAVFGADTREEVRSLIISGDILVQFNWLWKYLMPHVAFGIGYSYYQKDVENNYGYYPKTFRIRSVVTDTSDVYSLNVNYRKNFLFLVGEAGLTFFFNNYVGLTYSFGIHYAPKQSFVKNATLEKVSAGIANTDPILDMYKNLDGKMPISSSKGLCIMNFRLGITFRML